jgi:hypothetical protein
MCLSTRIDDIEIDQFNLLAIEALEVLGFLKPSEDEIAQMEQFLKNRRDWAAVFSRLRIQKQTATLRKTILIANNKQELR